MISDSKAPTSLIEWDRPAFSRVLQARLDRLANVDFILQIFPGGVFGQSFDKPPASSLIVELDIGPPLCN